MFYFISAFFYNVVVSWSIWYAAATLLGMDNGQWILLFESIHISLSLVIDIGHQFRLCESYTYNTVLLMPLCLGIEKDIEIRLDSKSSQSWKTLY